MPFFSHVTCYDYWTTITCRVFQFLCSDDGWAEGPTRHQEAHHQRGVRGQTERDPQGGVPRNGAHQVSQLTGVNKCSFVYTSCFYFVLLFFLQIGERRRRDHRGDRQPRKTQRHQQGTVGVNSKRGKWTKTSFVPNREPPFTPQQATKGDGKEFQRKLGVNR